MKKDAKRMWASVIALIMIMSIMPINAFAIEGEDTPESPALACVCEVKCTDEQVDESCPVCANDLTGCIGDPVQESGEDDRKEPELPSQPSVDDGDNAENTQTSPQPPVNQPNDQTKQELPDDMDAANDSVTNDMDQGAEDDSMQDQLMTLQAVPQNVEPVTTYEELKAAVEAGGTIVLGADITIEQNQKLTISKDTVIQNAAESEFRLLRNKDYTMIEVAEGVTFTLDGVTLSGIEEGYDTLDNSATTMVIVDDGATFNMINDARIYNEGHAKDSYGYNSRLITLNSEANLYMENSSISGFYHSSSSTTLKGTIYASSNATIHLVDSQITDCTTTSGGAIYADAGAKVILDGEDTVLEENGTRGDFGGAICLNGAKLTIDGATIRNNEPLQSYGTNRNHGGGIYATGTENAPCEIIIDSGTISDNIANNGGGIYAYKYTTITMNGGKISDNNALYFGGGVCIGDKTSKFIIYDGEITGNTLSIKVGGLYGGGIYSAGDLTIESDTAKISNNKIQGCNSLYGGGIAIWSGTLTIKGAVEISQNIITEHPEQTSVSNMFGMGICIGPSATATIDGANIVNNGQGKDVDTLRGYYELGGGIYNEGDLTVTNCKINNNTVKTNQHTRANGGAIYNVSNKCTVKGTEILNNFASDYGGAICTIMIQMEDCLVQNNTSGNIIGGIYATGVLKDTSGNGGEDNTTKLNISNCKILGNASQNGGGIYLGGKKSSSFISYYNIKDCEIAGNSSKTGSYAGGITATCTVNISNCDIHDNTSYKGGGLYFNAISYLEKANTVNNCKVYNNTAEYGGGAYVNALTNINNSQIYGNTTTSTSSSVGGGGIYVSNTTTINSSRIFENTSSSNGGGIFIRDYAGNLTVNSGVITSNTAKHGGGIYVYSGSATVKDGALFGNTAGAEGNTTTTSAGADLYAENGKTFQVPTVDSMVAYLSDPTHTEVTDADRAAILDDWYYDYEQGDSGAPSESTGVDRYQNGYKERYLDAGTSDTGYVPLIVGVTPTYSLSYRYSGEVPENAPALPDTASKKLKGDPVEVVAAPTMAGYTFSGWRVAEPVTGTVIENGVVTMPAANVILEGFWTKNPVYTLTYDANFEGGGRKTPDAACEAGTVLTIQGEKLFTRGEDYTLIDWNTNPNGDGTTYDFGESFTVPKDNTILYAQWKRNYTLTYISNGGSSVEPEQYLENETAQVDEEPEREGYTFEGWYADEALTIPVTEVEMTSDKYVYAKWKKISDGGASHPEYTPDDENNDRDDEDDTEEFTDEEVPLAETPWLNTEDHYAYIVGYSEDGTVRPNANITRAEVATIFFRLLTDDARDQFWSTSNNFSDVAPDAWYNNAVSTMVNAGIIQGYEDGTFRPNASITRAEFAAIASRFMSSGYDVEEDLFTDIANHWARENINDAAMTKWINGYPDGTFLPDKAITRAEAVTLVNNVLQRKPDADHMLDSMIKWPDNIDTSAWYYEAIQEATNSHDYDLFEGAEYETWTALQENRDWAALEKDWVNAHRTGGEVM